MQPTQTLSRINKAGWYPERKSEGAQEDCLSAGQSIYKMADSGAKTTLLGLAASSVTTLILSKERGETGVRVYQVDVLQGVVKHLNMTFISGQELVLSSTQFLPKSPRQLRSGCGGTFWSSSAPRTGPRGVQSSKPWTMNCGLFWRTWHAESVTTVWRAWGGLPGDGACGYSRMAGASQGLRWDAPAIISDIIINGNLKLLQINYLARKVDVLFNFPSRSPCTCNRTCGKT